jgi:predicted nucleic acid-binding protein
VTIGRVLLDSAVFIYAIGQDHPYRLPCRTLMTALRNGQLDGEASVLVAQEVMHQRARRTGDRDSAASASRELSQFCTLHELTPSDVRRAAELFEDVDGLDAADACHAATALSRGITVIVSPDDAFDAVAGLTRLDPADAATQLSSDSQRPSW